MRKKEIRNIIIHYGDTDFVRVWDWIGRTLLNTLTQKNICNEEMLVMSYDIENFVWSLIPIGIQFAQYRADNREKIDTDEIDRLTQTFYSLRFEYNYDTEQIRELRETSGSEVLLIDMDLLSYEIV